MGTIKLSMWIFVTGITNPAVLRDYALSRNYGNQSSPIGLINEDVECIEPNKAKVDEPMMAEISV